MTPERWLRIEELFEAALPLPAQERKRFLDQHCGSDSALREEVLNLLSHSGDTGTLNHIVGQAASATVAARQVWEGRRPGAYRIVRPIGAGGMGVVLLGGAR